MKVNPRKPIRLKNRTKYFDTSTCKTHVTFSSPDSYRAFKIKQEGYETRLYWQFRYCEDRKGQTFYYTLTYNDAHIPKYEGVNCFDYEDLRGLLTGGFRKILLRKYGTIFKYFIGAELGDGKGERGLHNNPHYHVLFFLEPAPDDMLTFHWEPKTVLVGYRKRSSKFGKVGDPLYKTYKRGIKVFHTYKPISPTDFRHLIRLYWQGFDEDSDGFCDYRTALYGIAREGDNCGKVTDFRACVYCAKYVVKDAGLKKKEDDLEKKIRSRLKYELSRSEEFHRWFFYNRLWNDFNTPLNAKHTKWSFPTTSALIWNLLPHDLFSDWGYISEHLTPVVLEICRRYSYWKQYYSSFKEYLDMRVKEAMNVYRNRYCNKVRISDGVGDYALNFVGDKFNPTFQVSDKDNGFKQRPMSMYYYRKLFTDVHIDSHGSSIRVLNDDGIKYKVLNLSKSIDQLVIKSSSNLRLVLDNRELYNKMLVSDVNIDVSLSYDNFLKYYERLCSESSVEEILNSYAVYKLVYEDRFFPFDFSGNSDVCGFPDINISADYARFLVPSFFSVSRSDIRLDLFLENNCPDCLPYSQHPYFLRYLGLYRVLDLCTDYFFIQDDIKKQKEAEDIAAVKRFHNKMELKSFYAQFV